MKTNEPKRHLWLLSVLSPSVPGLAAIALWLTGNQLWAALPVLFYFGAVPVFDAMIGEDQTNPDEAQLTAMENDPYYRVLLFASLPVFYFSMIASVGVAATMSLPIWAFILMALGAGVASGSAVTVAHELGHKPNQTDRIGAKIALALTGYGHFSIEHNRGHHVNVATPEDSASAKLGESVYAFAMREIPGAALGGVRMERERLRRRGLSFWHWRNDILQVYGASTAIALILAFLFGWKVLPFLLIHHATGWMQLTLANYVEHYGLLRPKRPDGRYEPCEPRHSWNTNHIVSNLMLFHLQRHSDHHSNPLRPYQILRNFEELPSLPSGYPGSYVLAVIPPLWFRVMDPKVMAWAGSDLDKCNRRPGYVPAAAGLSLQS